MYGYGLLDPNRKRNVSIYARVSTEHEAQLSALENQKDWYKPFLDAHPEWTVTGMYVDEGITGTSAQKRPRFMEMIRDAENGAFDLILTREVSRFARNTVDTLQYTRLLKSKGVEVYFINDNIKTFDGDGELRLTIMATLAQDESRKTSIRVKSGQQTSMNNGVVYGNGNILGYDRVDKKMVINPEQAKTVRMIYDWYLSGIGMRAIQFRLEQEGRLTAMGKSNWHQSNISKILQNSFYCGIMTYHKEFTPDYLTQKKIRNFGDIELTQTQGTHEPIVTVEEYEQVQRMIAVRRREVAPDVAGKRRPLGERQAIDVWTKLMICECGHKFNRKIWHKLEDKIQYGYQCYHSIRSGTVVTRTNKGLPLDGVCEVPMVPGWKLQMMANHLFQEYISDTAKVIELATEMLDKHIDEKPNQQIDERLLKQKTDELEKLNKRMHNLIEMRADGEITKDIFQAKQTEIQTRIEQLEKEIEALHPRQAEPEDNSNHEERMAILRYYLEQSIRPNENGDVPEYIIDAFVVKIVVCKDHFDWYLRFDPSKEPKQLQVDGKRKNKAQISSFCSPQDRLRLLRCNSLFPKYQKGCCFDGSPF